MYRNGKSSDYIKSISIILENKITGEILDVTNLVRTKFTLDSKYQGLENWNVKEIGLTKKLKEFL